MTSELGLENEVIANLFLLCYSIVQFVRIRDSVESVRFGVVTCWEYKFRKMPKRHGAIFCGWKVLNYDG